MNDEMKKIYVGIEIQFLNGNKVYVYIFYVYFL